MYTGPFWAGSANGTNVSKDKRKRVLRQVRNSTPESPYLHGVHISIRTFGSVFSCVMSSDLKWEEEAIISCPQTGCELRSGAEAEAAWSK